MHEAFQKAIDETKDDKREGLSLEQLREYRKELRAAPQHGLNELLRAQIRDRIASLDREIDLKRTEEKAEHRHQETLGIGKKTLICVIAGIVLAPLLTELGSVIRDTFFSKVPHASVPQSTPNSLRQNLKPTSVSPEPEANSSSATPPPEQAVTPQPLALPLAIQSP